MFFTLVNALLNQIILCMERAKQHLNAVLTVALLMEIALQDLESAVLSRNYYFMPWPVG